MMEKEKNNKKKNILIICLIFLIAALVALCVILMVSKNKIDKKDNKNSSNNNEVINDKNNETDNNTDDNKQNDKDSLKNTDTKRKLSKDEISFLMNKIEKYNLADLRNKDKKVVFDSSVNNEMLYAMFNYISSLDDKFNEHWDEYTWSFKEEKADDYFKDAFGFVPKKYQNLICYVDDEPLLIYNSDKKTFTYNDEHPGHGGAISGFIDYKVIDSNYDNGTYSVNVQFLIGNEADGYYINEEEFNPSSVTDDSNSSLYKEAFQKTDSSKYSSYMFEFKKIDNSYVLKSIVPKQ